MIIKPIFSRIATAAALLCAAQAFAADPTAMAALKPLGDSKVSGTIEFVQQGNTVNTHVNVTGLAPNSEHGFHVHEKGDCSAPDGTSAGGHFGPKGNPHGPQDAPHHAGDMPSLKSDANGHATIDFKMSDVTVAPGESTVVGKAVIVHAKPDDFKTQPSGNSGARVACGVVQAGAAR